MTGGFSKALAFCLALVLTPVAFAATPVGTVIPNIASLSYQVGANPAQTLQTNTVQTTVTAFQSPSTTQLYIYDPGLASASPVQVGPTSCSVGGSSFTTLPAPTVSGKSLNVANPQPLVAAGVYQSGDPAFVEVKDADANLDPAVRDTVVVTLTVAATGDVERIRLTETDINTGVFAGYIQTVDTAAKKRDCELSVASNSDIVASYTDAADSSDTSSATAPVDPSQVVFDSTSGARINGARITLLDAATGKPAQVLGYDGVSSYPSTVVSGKNAVDAAGRRYAFRAGTFRFPLVKPGTYRLKVEPPAGYAGPSSASRADLQALDGAPYVINAGSYGKDLVMKTMAPVQADIPLDPTTHSLFVQKSASVDAASVGDFVQFTVTVTNTSKTVTAFNVDLVDTLPQGMRYAKGSANVSGRRVADPGISGDGLALTFPVGQIAGGQSATVKYVVEVTAASQTGLVVNRAQGFVAGRAASNVGTATVQVQDDLMSAVNTLVGRVIVDDCDGKTDAPGLQNVRLFMETGTYSVTDKDGRFHFQGVQNGTHVVQLDTATLPDGYEMGDCIHNTRFAGRTYSQFVELHGGTLWRVDFHVHKVAPPAGTVSLQLYQISAGDGVTQQNSADLRVAGVPVKNVRLMIIPPDGVEYVAGSAALDGSSIADPDRTGGALQFHLGEADADWHGVVTFKTQAGPQATVGQQTRGVVTFDTPSASNQRTPAVSVSLPSPGIGRTHEVLTIQGFQPGKASLTARDIKTMNYLAGLLKKGRNVTVDVIGYTDNTPLGAGDRFKDNVELSRARAQLVADYIRQHFDLGTVSMRVDGHGDANPCGSNDTEEGRAANRRTEIDVGYDAAAIEGLPNKQASAQSDVGKTDTRGSAAASPAASLADKILAPQPEMKDTTHVDDKWFAGDDSTAAWVLPYDGYLPNAPAIKVAVRHAPSQSVRLSINGQAVDPANFLGEQFNATKTLAISQWLGVTLEEGDNQLVADVMDGDKVVAHLVRTQHYSGAPVRAELLPEKSVLVADGKTKPVLAFRLYDRWGYPVRTGMTGRYALLAPYQAYQSIQELQQQQLSAIGPRQPTYSVREDGIAYLVLAPTNTTGQLTLDIPMGESEVQELRAWMKPADRDWILVGVANGTAAFNNIKGHMETASSTDPNDDMFEDGRVAFYAKGMIKGEYLLTTSYDSAKQTGVNAQGLQQTVDPNQYFMLYGDGSEQANDAVSASKLYVKIERDQFYAMFGDYNTGLTVTELSRYDRPLNGVKSEYNGQHLGYSAFAAQNTQTVVKDQIQGDGTSGLYHLSHQQIILNSETLTLEVHDRFQPDVVLSTQPLTRYLDYNIDYLGGTVFFKQPVPSRDANFNPVYIVAQYEVNHGGQQQVTAGGRAALKFNDDKVEVGATMINEATGSPQGDNKLAGADLRVTLTQSLEFRAEVARTDTAATNATSGLVVSPTGNGLVSNPATSSGGMGSAYLAEFKARSDKLEGDLYIREEDANFGLGQQSLTETATRKVGVDGKYHLTDKLSIVGEAYHADSLNGGGTQSAVDTGLQYSQGNSSVTGGVRHAEQNYTALSALPAIGDNAVQTGQLSSGVTGATPVTAGSYSSNQVYVGGSTGVLDNKVTLHGETDQNVGGQGSDTQYPAATTVGADWHLTQAATLFVNQQFVNGSNQAYNRMTEVGARTAPWDQATLQTSVASQQTEYGPRNFSTMGLTQDYKATQNLTLSVGMDRVSSMSNPNLPAGAATGTGTTTVTSLTPVANPNAAPATGTDSEDFTSMFLGASYHKDSWSLTSRVEAMHSDSEKHRGVFTGFYRDLAGGDAFSLSLQGFDDRFDAGSRSATADARFGIAHRPDDSRWTVLNQLDFVYSDQQGALGSMLITPQQGLNQQPTAVSGLNPVSTLNNALLDQRTAKLINNLQANYLFSQRSQLSLYYGSKYVIASFDSGEYRGYTDLIGVEYRYDIKPNWDVGFLANREHSWSSNVVDRSFGLETGWSFATNMWVSLGYNFTGFYDQDFTATHYTAKGVFVRFRFKFDQDTIKDLAEHASPLH